MAKKCPKNSKFLVSKYIKVLGFSKKSKTFLNNGPKYKINYMESLKSKNKNIKGGGSLQKSEFHNIIIISNDTKFSIWGSIQVLIMNNHYYYHYIVFMSFFTVLIMKVIKYCGQISYLNFHKAKRRKSFDDFSQELPLHDSC